MTSSNDTGVTPSTLILIGIAGLEDYHFWFAVPLCTIYILTVLGNCTLLLAIKMVLNLHKPMYFFIAQLAFSDLVMSSSIIPKMLGIFWFNDREIHFSACLSQMFVTECFMSLESSILSAMAVDRYFAVCSPLRYCAIVTGPLIGRIAAVSLARSTVMIAPISLFAMTLPFCSRHILHSYCENMAVAKLSCADVTFNKVYSLVVCVLMAIVDIFCIALSYILILRTILYLPSKDRAKAFSTCGSHLCVMSMFFIPVFISLALHRSHHNIPMYVHIIIANIHLLLPPLINPFIYGLTMKEVWQGMRQMFHVTVASHRHFKLLMTCSNWEPTVLLD